MEALIEALVTGFLTRGGSVFVGPQFNIAWDKEAGQGGACPDFVALDFERQHVVIVEVSTGDDLKKLYEKIGNRKQHWYPPVRRHLEKLGAINANWQTRFLGIVRDERVDDARRAFGDSDVTFHPLESALLEYSYSKARQMGLP